MSKVGIKNTKELMIFGMQLGLAGKMAMADGKLSVADLGLVAKVFPHIGPAVDDIGDVPAELKDIDADEAQELLMEAARQIPNVTDSKRLGLIVIKSIKVALSVGELVKAVSYKEEEVVPAEENVGAESFESGSKE